VDPRGLEVVSLDRNGRQQIVNEGPPCGLSPPIGKFDADQELCRGDGCDRDVIVIAHDLVDCRASSFGGDQDCRVEDQPFQ
jgi:hypothetical protein